MTRVVSKKPVGEWEHVCKSCHYKVSFVPSDVWEGRDPDDNTQYRYVTCPSCHVMIDMPKRNDYEDDTY